jgi:hypothetical protein
MSQIDIDKMKLKELKAECKKKGLPVSGNKSVLIARLKAGKAAIKRKASRKPRKRKSAKKAAKKSRKRKSAKKAAKKSRKRKSAKKAAKKSRKRKSAKKAAKKVAKRKPSTKKPRTQDWAEMTKAEISKELKSMKVTEIRKSPKLKPFLKGKSKAKKQELVDHLTDVLSSGQALPVPKAKRKSAKKQSRKAIKKSAKKKAPKKSVRKASTKVSRKVSKKAGKSWGIKLTKKFTRGSVKKNKDRLFIFGENDECFPVGEKWRKDGEIDEDDEECYQLSTQAQIRGEPNAAPIVTISRKGASDKELKSMMKRDVEAILKEMKSGKYKDLVLSSQLVGTGVANLPKKKPEVWKFLQEQLARLKSGGVLPRPPLGSDKSSINVFTGWLLDKEIRKKPQKVIPRKSRKSVAKPTKPKASTKVITPVPQDSNADIEKAIRKCLYGDSDILPTETPKEAEPEIVDDDEEEEELEIVDDE